MRARRPPGAGGKPSGGSPGRRPPGSRPRRNSDSSIVDKEKPLTEEEKKARDARRRERERRYREHKASKEKEKEKDPKGKPSKKLDLIDALDATSIYGTGRKCTVFQVLVPYAPNNLFNSVPPRWSFRRLQPKPEQAREPARANACFC